MINVFLSLGILLLSGTVLRYVPNIPSAHTIRAVIGTLVLRIFLPALTFSVVYRAPINSDLWAIPAVSACCTIICFGFAWIVFARGLKKWLLAPAIGSLLLASVWCNATYLGLPLVTALIGPEVSRVPVLFDLLAMSPLLFTIGTLICVEYGTRGVQHTIGAGLVQAIKLPPTIAVAVGLIFNISGIPVPDAIMDASTIAGKVVAPLMMVSVGLAMHAPNWRKLPILVPVVLIKLVVAPIVGLMISNLLISDQQIFRAVVLESAMPTMMITMVFAEKYGLDEELLAQAILVTTIVSVVTIGVLNTLVL